MYKIITESKTLDDSDENILLITDDAVTLTLPADVDSNFQDGDWIEFVNGASSGTLQLDTDAIEFKAIGEKITKKYGYAKIEKIGPDCWVGYGDLVA